MFRRVCSLTVLAAFVLNTVIGPNASAQSPALPRPGTMVALSESFMPVILKGMVLHPENPLVFDFIVDNGNTGLKGDELIAETTMLAKYFLAGIAIPEKDLWVNLSPYERDRIIEENFSHTDMGRDLLAQDYFLKQLTSSLIYPEKELGKKFWDQVYAMAQEKFGSTDIPVDTFNKVWIAPDTATVYRNGNNVLVARARLKVMLESDYLAEREEGRGKIEERSTEGDRSSIVLASPQGANGLPSSIDRGSQDLSKQVMREVILPVLEKEVNEGKNFASLRQVFHSMILANWYKNALKESLLARVYADSRKTEGIEIDTPGEQVERIYNDYVAAFKTGVFNYIKEDFDRTSGEAIPRKYFSGGANLAMEVGQEDNAVGVKPAVGDGTMLSFQLQSAVRPAAITARDGMAPLELKRGQRSVALRIPDGRAFRYRLNVKRETAGGVQGSSARFALFRHPSGTILLTREDDRDPAATRDVELVPGSWTGVPVKFADGFEAVVSVQQLPQAKDVVTLWMPLSEERYTAEISPDASMAPEKWERMKADLLATGSWKEWAPEMTMPIFTAVQTIHGPGRIEPSLEHGQIGEGFLVLDSRLPFPSEDLKPGNILVFNLGLRSPDEARTSELAADAAMVRLSATDTAPVRVATLIAQGQEVIRQFEGPTYFETRDGNAYNALWDMLAALGKDVSSARTKANWEEIRRRIAAGQERTMAEIETLAQRNLSDRTAYRYDQRAELKDRLVKVFEDVSREVNAMADAAMSARAERVSVATELPEGASLGEMVASDFPLYVETRGRARRVRLEAFLLKGPSGAFAVRVTMDSKTVYVMGKGDRMVAYDALRQLAKRPTATGELALQMAASSSASTDQAMRTRVPFNEFRQFHLFPDEGDSEESFFIVPAIAPREQDKVFIKLMRDEGTRKVTYFLGDTEMGELPANLKVKTVSGDVLLDFTPDGRGTLTMKLTNMSSADQEVGIVNVEMSIGGLLDSTSARTDYAMSTVLSAAEIDQGLQELSKRFRQSPLRGVGVPQFSGETPAQTYVFSFAAVMNHPQDIEVIESAAGPGVVAEKIIVNTGRAWPENELVDALVVAIKQNMLGLSSGTEILLSRRIRRALNVDGAMAAESGKVSALRQRVGLFRQVTGSVGLRGAWSVRDVLRPLTTSDGQSPTPAETRAWMKQIEAGLRGHPSLQRLAQGSDRQRLAAAGLFRYLDGMRLVMSGPGERDTATTQFTTITDESSILQILLTINYGLSQGEKLVELGRVNKESKERALGLLGGIYEQVFRWGEPAKRLAIYQQLMAENFQGIRDIEIVQAQVASSKQRAFYVTLPSPSGRLVLELWTDSAPLTTLPVYGIRAYQFNGLADAAMGTLIPAGGHSEQLLFRRDVGQETIVFEPETIKAGQDVKPVVVKVLKSGPEFRFVVNGVEQGETLPTLRQGDSRSTYFEVGLLGKSVQLSFQQWEDGALWLKIMNGADEWIVASSSDAAMEEPKVVPTGGIDLGNGDFMNVIETGPAGMPVFDPAEVTKFKQDLRGLVPVPIGLPQPVSLPALLGLADGTSPAVLPTASASGTMAVIRGNS